MIENLGVKLREAREKAGSTQVEVSVELGCSLSTISKLENSGSVPKIKSTLKNIEEYVTKWVA